MNPLQPRANFQFNPFEPLPGLDNIESPKADYVNDSDAWGMFAARGLAPPKILHPDEVRREAKDRRTNIFANYRALQSILERHEATIQKRWEKMTRTKRIGILLQLWSDMPLTHRPDFAAFRKHAGDLNSVAIQYRSSFIWPIINQEDLGEPKALLLLLNSRGRNHPSLFAAYDGELNRLGRTTMSIVPIFLNEYVMTLNGITQEADYGKLVAWGEHEDAFDWMHTRKQFIPGEGLLILEFQDRILQFLVNCCKMILHDIPLEQMMSSQFTVQPEPLLKQSIDATGIANLAVMAKEAPYRVPAHLNLEKIESLLSARTAQAEDHIWSLREDPSYFAETIVELKEHRQEILKDIRGDAHPATTLPCDDLIWARVISSVIVESFLELESYAELQNQAAHLRKLSAKYGPKLSPQKDLPEEYLAALLKFRHYLSQASRGVFSRLKVSVVASPPLRPFYVRNVPISSNSSKISVVRNGRKMDKITENLIWLLRTLWEDGNDLFLCRMTNVIDELDRLLKAEPKASDLASSYVTMLIGELSIVGECLRQLEMFQPWANGFEMILVDREKDIKEEFVQRTEVWAQMLDTFKDQNCIPLRRLGDPSHGRFQYPIGKRMNKANAEVLRKSEANLDEFWRAVDSMLYRTSGSMNGTAYKRLFSQPRYLQRTPEWVEPHSKKEDNSNEGQNPKTSLCDFVLNPFSGPFQVTGPVPSARAEALAAAAGRIKVKRCREPGIGSTSQLHVAPPPTSLPDLRPTFEVDARSLKVFRLVFFTQAANTTAGEVPWREFLHAMGSTGFTAQKLYGSVWHFQPTRCDVERSIQFHEPHPQGKIPFEMARRYGRRLNRAYGWHGAMFVLKEKTKASA
ncbi:hypothetical protein F5Y08DRAFT_319602 [Xylaria arbuscula]|nr:hypothetical protein F5Y08DRAFT_319602 [Xylaria arbuscula]